MDAWPGVTTACKVIMTLQIPIGLLSNGMMVLAVARTKSLRTPIHALVTNLCLADLGLAGISSPLFFTLLSLECHSPTTQSTVQSTVNCGCHASSLRQITMATSNTTDITDTDIIPTAATDTDMVLTTVATATANLSTSPVFMGAFSEDENGQECGLTGVCMTLFFLHKITIATMATLQLLTLVAISLERFKVCRKNESHSINTLYLHFR